MDKRKKILIVGCLLLLIAFVIASWYGLTSYGEKEELACFGRVTNSSNNPSALSNYELLLIAKGEQREEIICTKSRAIKEKEYFKTTGAVYIVLNLLVLIWYFLGKKNDKKIKES